MEERKTRDALLAGLLSEILAADATYGKLATDNHYTRKTAFFRSVQQQKRQFALRLAHEHYVLYRVRQTEFPATQPGIYTHLPVGLAEGTMTSNEVDRWVINSEQELADAYQRVLLSPGLPNVTYALLESQAEEINGSLLKLRADLRIHTRNPPVTVFVAH